jgi:hypothetical protein
MGYLDADNSAENPPQRNVFALPFLQNVDE